MAYYLALALARVQQISPFSNITSNFHVLLLTWGYSVAIRLGFSLSPASNFSLEFLSFYSLLASIVMNVFKIYMSVLTIQTFDTVYWSVTIHFLVIYIYLSITNPIQYRERWITNLDRVGEFFSFLFSYFHILFKSFQNRFLFTYIITEYSFIFFIRFVTV